MKLLDVYISGFGKFHDQSVTFQDGLNIVYGKNEAGKSTLHTFIRSMLFGMERQRGRAAKTDSYSRFLPWENKGGYEGRLRLEKNDHIYRIERNFQNNKEFTIVDETLGKEIEPTKTFMESLLNGLSETAYSNTISIGQLKSATDSGMVTELRNYIANLNTSGNMALNITKATAFLKAQKKALEREMVPEAARSYASLLGEIRNIEKETAAPEYENHLTSYRKQREQMIKNIAEKQTEKEDLLQKIARGRQLLNNYQFTDGESIQNYQEEARIHLWKLSSCQRRLFPYIYKSLDDFFLFAVCLLSDGMRRVRLSPAIWRIQSPVCFNHWCIWRPVSGDRNFTGI